MFLGKITKIRDGSKKARWNPKIANFGAFARSRWAQLFTWTTMHNYKQNLKVNLVEVKERPLLNNSPFFSWTICKNTLLWRHRSPLSIPARKNQPYRYGINDTLMRNAHCRWKVERLARVGCMLCCVRSRTTISKTRMPGWQLHRKFSGKWYMCGYKLPL